MRRVTVSIDATQRSDTPPTAAATHKDRTNTDTTASQTPTYHAQGREPSPAHTANTLVAPPSSPPPDSHDYDDRNDF